MTEKEFRALLALEGRWLDIVVQHFRSTFSPYEVVRHVNAVVRDKDGTVDISSGFVRRRWYAVQKVIEGYYDD